MVITVGKNYSFCCAKKANRLLLTVVSCRTAVSSLHSKQRIYERQIGQIVQRHVVLQLGGLHCCHTGAHESASSIDSPTSVHNISLLLMHTYLQLLFNSLLGTGNHSATWNNMKLVHWPSMGGLLQLLQWGGDWAGPQPTQAPPRCTKCNSPPHPRPVYQLPHCCIMVLCSMVLMCPLKG